MEIALKVKRGLVDLEVLINNHKHNFKEWQNTNLITFMESFEEFSMNSYQISNLHLYHQSIEELYNRFPNEPRYQYRQWFFTENNPLGKNTYLDYLNWSRGSDI